MAVAVQRFDEYHPAVAYLRRSTDRQEQSIADQRKAIQRYAEEHGFTLLDQYVDDAISGTSAEERKAFLRLIEDGQAADCPFRYVLVYDVKRFGRLDNDEAGYYRYQLRRNGVEVVYVSEGFNGDDTDDLLRPVKQWQARQESKDLSKVTIRGLLSRAGAGWWSGGVPPFGYDLAYYAADGRFLMTVRYEQDCSKSILDEEGNVLRQVPRGEALNLTKRDRCRLVPSAPERIEVIRNIFSCYVHEGLGFKGIAERLNRQGVPSPRGGYWSRTHRQQWAMTTIRDLLLNPAYTGDFVWNRLTFAKFHRIRQGQAVARPGVAQGGFEQNRPEDWVVVRDAHPPLISRTLFEEAQRKRRERRAKLTDHFYRSGRGANSSYLLSGLIRCERCGHNWQGYHTTKGRKRADGSNVRTYYYACGGYVSKGNSVCRRAVIPQQWIEEWVLGQIGEIVQGYLKRGGEERLRRMIEQELAVPPNGNGTGLAALRQRKTDIEHTIENLLDNITPTNRDYVDRRIEKLRDETVELERKEAVLLEQHNREAQAGEFAEQAFALMREVPRLVALGTTEEKRVLMRAFLSRIDFDPESRSGTASFWGMPMVTEHGGPAAPAGRGRRRDLPLQGAGTAEHDRTPNRRITFDLPSGGPQRR